MRYRWVWHPLRAAAALCLLIAYSGIASAQGGPTIAVLPFESLEISAAVARAVSGLVETNLVNSGAYTVLSQNERDKILEAQEASLADCTDEGCAVRIGRLLAAEQIVVGTVAALGSKLIVNAKIIDIATSRTVAADSISAPSVEDLDGVCDRLIRSLVASSASRLAAGIRPGRQIATAGERDGKPGEGAPAKGLPSEAGGPEESRPAGAQPGEPVGTPEEGRDAAAGNKARPAGTLNAWSYLALPGAILAADLGNLSRSVGFELQLASDWAYRDYVLATSGSDFTSLYGTYETAYDGYAFAQVLSYSLWGLGGIAATLSYLLFPPETYSLSRWGKVSYHTGLSLIAAGSIFSMLADNLAYKDRDLWGEYAQAPAGSDFDALYKAYTTSHTWYGICKVSSYSLWALGGLGVAGSFLLPGEKEPLAPGPTNRLLLAAGTGAIVLGGVTHSLAQGLRVQAAAAERDYLAAPAGADFDALYSEYERYHGWYVANSVASYVLWTAGAAAVVTSMFIRPGGTGEDRPSGRRERPTPLLVVPTPSGVFVQIALRPKGGVEE